MTILIGGGRGFIFLRLALSAASCRYRSRAREFSHLRKKIIGKITTAATALTIRILINKIRV
jgi:hypothetical protein